MHRCCSACDNGRLRAERPAARTETDPRRRASDEVSLGRDWLDADGQRFELIWVVDTGELYLMGEPAEPVEMDALGDAWVQDLPVDQIKVEILATIADRADVDSTLAGWESTLHSLASDAAVTCAIMKPECTPASRARKGGSP